MNKNRIGNRATPKEVLNIGDYRNYRNIRAVAAFFVFMGSILLLAGVSLIVANSQGAGKPLVAHTPGLAIVLVGLAGIKGGMATRRGNRQWAWLIYVIATLYLFVFPFGTLLSCVLFAGMSRYLDSADRVKNATAAPAKPPTIVSPQTPLPATR